MGLGQAQGAQGQGDDRAEYQCRNGVQGLVARQKALEDRVGGRGVGRGRGGVAAALARIEARTAVVGITTDIIFTPAEMRELHGMIAGSTYHEIDSPFGHDGFLVEHGQLNDILYPFMNNQ